MENDKPQGYYDEIEITASKKNDLLQFLNGYEVSVYSNSDEGYDYLEDNDLMLVVKNPYCDETLDIELAGEFSLFFAGWHTHYFTYEFDYEEMKKDIMGLLKGKFGDKFKRLGGCIKIVYWNPADTISFDVVPGNLTPIRKFPRRSTVRFVVQGDKTIGSGSYKKFDDETACLSYLWIEPSEEYDEKAVYKELYEVLEKDIVADGYKTIFTLCDNDEREFYHEKDYQVGKERDQDVLTDLMGAEVIHDVTMEKNIG